MVLLPQILLVEPDAALREALSFSLELEGFRVTAFASPEAVLDAVHTEIDCLVVDYRLPGIDGLALLASLRAPGGTAPSVLIASTPSRVVRAKASAAGVLLVEKPLLCDTLTAAIRAQLRARAEAA